MKKQRLANIELLRSISMFMVVAIHLFTKTSVLWNMDSTRPIYAISWVLYGLCMTGVSCYVIISGYFLCDSSFKLEKLFKIYCQVLFYSVTLAVIAKYVLGLEMTSRWLAVFLPITNREYWFATVYIGLYCLMPFVNILIRALTQKQFQNLLVILSVLFCIIPTFLHADSWLEDGGAYGIVWFIFLYLIGAYIKIYYNNNLHNKAWILYAGAILLIPVSKFIIMLAGGMQNIIDAYTVSRISEVFYCANSVPALCASVLLFICFSRITIENERIISIINLFSGTTFGIYLLHNNRNLSHCLWERVRVDYWLIQRENILMIMLIMCMIFVICGLIEGIRKVLFKVLRLDWLINKAAHYFEGIMRRVFNEI